MTAESAALAAMLSLVDDAQKALSRALTPGGDWGDLIELLDGPRQRMVQGRARSLLDAPAARS
jgi:Xaa-Pro aminopeptidase